MENNNITTKVFIEGTGQDMIGRLIDYMSAHDNKLDDVELITDPATWEMIRAHFFRPKAN